MTRDDIIRMAREAGYVIPAYRDHIEIMERFAALVAAAEREACAKLCDDEQPANPWKPVSTHLEGQFEMAGHLAERIRARGKA